MLVVDTIDCRPPPPGAFLAVVETEPIDDLGVKLARAGFLVGAAGPVSCGASSCFAFDDAVGATSLDGSSTGFRLSAVGCFFCSGSCLAADAAVGAVR